MRLAAALLERRIYSVDTEVVQLEMNFVGVSLLRNRYILQEHAMLLKVIFKLGQVTS